MVRAIRSLAEPAAHLKRAPRKIQFPNNNQ
jgi:hypothetical protein